MTGNDGKITTNSKVVRSYLIIKTLHLFAKKIFINNITAYIGLGIK